MWNVLAVFVAGAVCLDRCGVLASSGEGEDASRDIEYVVREDIHIASEETEYAIQEGEQSERQNDIPCEMEQLTALLSASGVISVDGADEKRQTGETGSSDSESVGDGNAELDDRQWDDGDSGSEEAEESVEDPRDDNQVPQLIQDDPDILIDTITYITTQDGVMNAVADSDGNPRVILAALRRLWSLKSIHGFAMTLSCFPHSLPLDEDLGQVLAEVLWEGKFGRDEWSLPFCEELLRVRASTAMAEIAVGVCVAVPTMPMMRVLRKYFVKTAPSSLIAEWSNWLDGVAGDFAEQRGFLLDWLDTAISLEFRPLDGAVVPLDGGLRGVIGRVSRVGLCYLSVAMPACSLADDRTDISVENGQLMSAQLGTITANRVHADRGHYAITYQPPSQPTGKTATVVIVTPSPEGEHVGNTVTVHKLPSHHQTQTQTQTQISECPKNTLIIFADCAVLEVLTNTDMTGYLMFADGASFQNDLYTVLMAVAERRRRMRSVVLAGFLY